MWSKCNDVNLGAVSRVNDISSKLWINWKIMNPLL